MRTWRPSKTASREFATKMQDPTEKAAYEERKAAKADKRRATSKFDYTSAGGSYVPTKAQHDAAFEFAGCGTEEQNMACNMVMGGYTCNQRVDHDSIHIVNELIRRNESRSN